VRGLYLAGMEVVLRAAVLFAVVGLALGVTKFLHESPVEHEIARLQAEVARLSEANERLEAENQRYRTLVRGLRDDPRVLDRRARETLGLARPDELILFFPEARPTATSQR
jgi:cell division protein FtsB